ncbi:MAG: EF-hand domain-containing protein [Sulfurovum sp.]|nr:EF-hand domain-containing protein [Sulfurovum sp.]MDD3603491.1 EF-hand domain-containing protein [Sulfurovum sp.]
MKKLAILATLAYTAWAADFSQMSTEQLMGMRGNVPAEERAAFQQEMQKRMQTMSPQERQAYMQSNNGMMRGGRGMAQNRGMNQPQFIEFDLNNDGKITPKEFEEGRTKRMTKLAQEGKMLRNAGNAPAFEEIDTDKDGTITPNELEAHQMQQMQNPNKGNGMMRGGRGMAQNRGMNQPEFAEYDLNNDGKITPKEFEEGRTKRMAKLAQEGKMLRNAGNAPAFEDIDTDKDGTITPNELEAHQMQQMQNPNKGNGMMRGGKN